MEELDVKQLIKIFWNKRLSIIIIVFLFLVIGTVYSYTMVKPKYEAYTTLVLVQSELTTQEKDKTKSTTITQSDITLNQKLISTYSELVKTKNILREVIKNLKLDVNEDSLKKNVTVSLVKETELIKITVKNANALDAKNIANEIAKIFSKRVAEIYNINNVYIIDEAEEPETPCNISHAKDIIIFIFIGIVVAIAYVLLTNLLDTTVKSEEDIEKELGITVLASIPIIIEEKMPKNKGGIY